jgi:hypothetical protein
MLYRSNTERVVCPSIRMATPTGTPAPSRTPAGCGFGFVGDTFVPMYLCESIN